jgi:hypothetical protein
LFFQSDVFKLQEVFSELGFRVFLENGIGDFKFYRFETNQRCLKYSKNSFEIKIYGSFIKIIIFISKGDIILSFRSAHEVLALDFYE